MRGRLRRAPDNVERGWPDYLFGGRVRTSTAVLVIAFVAFWWVYDDHQQAGKATKDKTTQVPATQVVPPGYVPDPNYTWVPRTRVQQPKPTVTVTETPTPTPTPTTTTRPTPPPPTPPPLIPPIVLPPPFGPPTSTSSPVAPTTAPPPPIPPPPPLLPLLPDLPFPAPAH